MGWCILHLNWLNHTSESGFLQYFHCCFVFVIAGGGKGMTAFRHWQPKLCFLKEGMPKRWALQWIPSFLPRGTFQAGVQGGTRAELAIHGVQRQDKCLPLRSSSFYIWLLFCISNPIALRPLHFLNYWSFFPNYLLPFIFTPKNLSLKFMSDWFF